MRYGTNMSSTDILRKKDKERILQKVCDVFVHNHSFYSTWIALTDKSDKVKKIYESGIGNNFIPMAKMLNLGRLPD